MSEAPAGGAWRRVRFDLADGAMTGIAMGEESRPVDVLFLHATGFNALTYRTLLAPLAERRHVVAVDVRGHGRNETPARRFGYVSWAQHRDDVVALMERHFTRPVTLAGHSMGATVSLLAAAARPDLVGALALIEPVILPARVYAAAQLPFGAALTRAALPIARRAARRRARFAHREEAFAAFLGRGFFKNFPDEVLIDYLRDGLVEEGEGVRLACAPAYEAATFAAQRHDPWRALKRATAPLVLLRAARESTIPAKAAQRLAALRPDARIATVEGATHALPMERPDRARAAIEAAALMAAQRRTFKDVE